MNKKKTNPHRGSRFEDFLREEGLHAKVVAQAEKEILAWKLQSAMKERKVTVSGLARRMKTSRAALDRFLAPGNASVTLQTLSRAARAIGRDLRIELV